MQAHRYMSDADRTCAPTSSRFEDVKKHGFKILGLSVARFSIIAGAVALGFLLVVLASCVWCVCCCRRADDVDLEEGRSGKCFG
jgi:hypothetical protein